MTLPIDRTPLALAQANQVAGKVASAQNNIDTHTNAYNTIDELNQKVNNHTDAAVLPHPDGSVTTPKLANSAVTTPKLIDFAVTSPKIAVGAVGANQLDPTLLTNFGDIAVQAEFDRRGISVLKFGAKGDGVTDDTAALQAVRDYVASQAQPPKVIFPAGIYKYSVSPNWAISDIIVEAEGEVRLRYTGTGNAVILDAGEVTGLAWHINFGKFLVECPSTAQNAVFVRGIHSSTIRVKVLGAGTDYAGLRTEWCVCTDFDDYVCSNNHEGWYLGAKPKYGIFIDKRELQPVGTGGYTSWCSFRNPKIEGCQIGIHIERGQGNSFYSGTSEGHSQTGIVLSANAIYSKFFGIDLEANTNYDIYCLGKENEFYGCDSTGTHVFEGYARDNVIIGGSHNAITFNTNTYGNILQNIKYNRFNNGSGINDISGKNRLMSNRNVGLNRTENRPPSSSVITVGASPFTYINESGNDELIHIFGGTISVYLYAHGGYGDSGSTVPLYTRLCPGDSVRITYSVAPTMRKYTT